MPTSSGTTAGLNPQETATCIYRVLSPEEAEGAFEGITTQAARWTSAGASVVYASRSAAGALLEFLAHLEGETPRDLRLVVASLPAELISPAPSLPERWDERPYRPEVQKVGDAWVESGSSLALEVPSALCNRTANVIVNTAHADLARLAVLSSDVIRVDPRLRT